MGRFIRATAGIVAAVLVLLAATEYGYRYHTSRKFSHAKFGITLVDELYQVEDIRPRRKGDGLYLPNLKVNYLGFNAEHTLLYRSRIETNAQGYRSVFDYPPPTDSGEFRVAVLGDSMTASHLADAPWTDVVHQRLNADAALKAALGVKRFFVYNFGVKGAGFDTFAQVYQDHARRFRPHMVVTNFITPDILRTQLRVEPETPLGIGIPLYRGNVDVSVDEIAASIVLSCTTPPLALGRSDCTPETLMRIDARHMGNKVAVAAAKKRMSQQFIWTKLWRSTYPYSFAAALGEKFVVTDKKFTDIIGLIQGKVADQTARAPSASHAAHLKRSAAAIARIRDLTKDLVILHNPTSGELLAGVKRIPLAVQLGEAAKTRVIHMGELLRNVDNKDEVTSWFNLPHDSHFNNKGIRIYGEAVTGVIEELLLSGDWPGGKKAREFDAKRAAVEK